MTAAFNPRGLRLADAVKVANAHAGLADDLEEASNLLYDHPDLQVRLTTRAQHARQQERIFRNLARQLAV